MNNPYPSAYHWEIKNPFSKAVYQLKTDLITEEITKIYCELGFKDPKILDYGCGDGKIISSLKFTNIEGYDQNPDAIRFAKEKLPKHLFHNYPPQGPYDIILSLDVIEHCQDDSQILNNINAMLKDDGYLIITIPTTNLRKSHKHYRHYNYSMIAKLCENDYELKSLTGYVKINNFIEKLLWNNNQRLPKFLIKYFVKETKDLDKMGYMLMVMQKRKK